MEAQLTNTYAAPRVGARIEYMDATDTEQGKRIQESTHGREPQQRNTQEVPLEQRYTNAGEQAVTVQTLNEYNNRMQSIQKGQQHEDGTSATPEAIARELKNMPHMEPEDVNKVIAEVEQQETEGKPLDRHKLFDLIKAIFAMKKIVHSYKLSVSGEEDREARKAKARIAIDRIKKVLEKYRLGGFLLDSLIQSLDRIAEEEVLTPEQKQAKAKINEIREEPDQASAFSPQILLQAEENNPIEHWSITKLVEGYAGLKKWEQTDENYIKLQENFNRRKELFSDEEIKRMIRDGRVVQDKLISALAAKGIPADFLDAKENLHWSLFRAPDRPPVVGGGQQRIVVDPALVQDQELRLEFNSLNRRYDNRTLDLTNLDDAKKRYLDKMRDPNMSPQDKSAAENILIRLDEVRSQLLQEEQDKQKQRERAYREYGRDPEEFNMMVAESLEGSGLSVRDFFTSRRAREIILNDILAAADTSPAEEWRNVTNALTHPGRRLESFKRFLLDGNISPGRFPKWLDFDGIDKQQASEIIRNDYQRIIEEIEVRGIMHDLNSIMYLPSIKMENIMGFAQKLESRYGDTVNRMEGVKEMKRIMEMTMRQVMAENNGWLPPTTLTGEYESQVEERRDPQGNIEGKDVVRIKKTGEVEERARKLFVEMYKKGQVFQWNEKDLRPIPVEARTLKDWEVDRIFVLARGMMIAEGRFIAAAAESKVNPKGPIASNFLQDLLQNAAPFRHLIGKYNLTEEQFVGLFANTYMSKKDLIEAYHEYHEHGQDFLQGIVHAKNPRIAEMARNFLINQVNPNECGDIYTYASWRFANSADATSAVTRFLQKGREQMQTRIQAGKFSDADKDEYEKWIGTGLRFELLRNKLQSGDAEARKKAEKILEQMVRLQPHWIYILTKSTLVKGAEDRFKAKGYDISAGTPEKQKTDGILKNLALAEQVFYQNREEFLDNEMKFDEIQYLNPSKLKSNEYKWFYNKLQNKDVNGNRLKYENGNAMPDGLTEAEIDDMLDFAKVVQEDFHANRNDYVKKYITERNVNFGFALFGPDASLLNMADLGPTGVYARRYRDWGAESEAAILELQLLGSLHKFRSVDEVLEKFYEIYEKISNYDPGKAKLAIKKLSTSIGMFYRANGIASIAGVGDLWRALQAKQGHKILAGSFAQYAFGPQAMVWDATTENYFIREIGKRGWLTPEQAHEVKKSLKATELRKVVHLGTKISEIVAIILMLYIISKMMEEQRY